MNNYRSTIRHELAAQSTRRVAAQSTRNASKVYSEPKRHAYISKSTNAWNAASQHSVDTSYEDLEAGFWGQDNDDDDDMKACFF